MSPPGSRRGGTYTRRCRRPDLAEEMLHRPDLAEMLRRSDPAKEMIRHPDATIPRRCRKPMPPPLAKKRRRSRGRRGEREAARGHEEENVEGGRSPGIGRGG